MMYLSPSFRQACLHFGAVTLRRTQELPETNENAYEMQLTGEDLASSEAKTLFAQKKGETGYIHFDVRTYLHRQAGMDCSDFSFASPHADLMAQSLEPDEKYESEPSVKCMTALYHLLQKAKPSPVSQVYSPVYTTVMQEFKRWLRFEQWNRNTDNTEAQTLSRQWQDRAETTQQQYNRVLRLVEEVDATNF